MAAIALAVAAVVLPGVAVHGPLRILAVSAPIGITLAMLSGLARALASPALTALLALAGWAIDAVVVLLADALMDDFVVDGFWAAVWTGLVLTAVAGAFSWLVDPAAT